MENITIPITAHEYTAVTRFTDTRPVKPCPFCGEHKEIWAAKYMTPVGERFAVICFGCMATVDPGFCQDEWAALHHWERRK